jgi:hypothetical protein
MTWLYRTALFLLVLFCGEKQLFLVWMGGKRFLPITPDKLSTQPNATWGNNGWKSIL